jgi:putative holliday junction resolvase
MKTYIALDWGERKIGTAFGDDETAIAFAGEVFEHTSEIYALLSEYAARYRATCFLIGTTTNQLQNDNALAIDLFAQKLAKITLLPVTPVEEMFTSRQAQANRKEAGKKVLGNDDCEAARILLQDFFMSKAMR